jgi:tetratricopeptide (TPR) repeat protein
VLAVPAVATLGIAVALVLDEGGFPPPTWYPWALLALALAVVVVATSGRPAGGRWWGARAALLLLGAFTVWSFLSITWAAIPGEAWDGSNRTLFYLVVLGMLALRPWPPAAVRWALLVLVAALSVLAVGLLVDMASRSDPESLFQARRLAWPTGYANATANLWLIGVPASVWLSCDPRLAWWARGLCLGAAGLLFETALLAQSRGGVVAVTVGLAVLLLAAPRRWPVLLSVAAVVAAGVAFAGPVLDLLDATRATFSSDLFDARMSIVTVAALCLGAGVALALLVDRAGARVPDRVGNRGNHLLGLVALLAVAGALIAVGNPVGWVEDRWDDFKNTGSVEVSSTGGRFTGSLGSNRYDFYRVGVDAFRDQPLRGIGADSYGVRYLTDRRSEESPHYAHSLAISTLAELGVIGALLLAGFLAAAALAVVRTLRRAERAAAASSGPAAAALAGFAVFLGGAMVDWLWQFTALGVIGFALLALALRGAAPDDSAPAEPEFPRVLPRRAARAGLSLAAVGAALSLAMPSVAARFTDSAYEASATNPGWALERLDRAAHYNPLSSGPLLAEGIIARRVGDFERAHASFTEALEREPESWFAYFERAMVATLSEDWAAARADVERAVALNPRQTVIDVVARAVRTRKAAPAAELEAELTAQLTRRLRPLGD